MEQHNQTKGSPLGSREAKFFKKNGLLLIFPLALILALLYSFRKLKRIQSDFQDYKTSVAYMENYHIWYSIFKTTLYTLHPSECSKTKEHRYFGITKSGFRAVKNRTVAVDPKVVPLGSILIDIETGVKYIAEDTGNAVKGYHIDIFIGEGTKENRDIASNYGCQNKLFIIIE